MAPVLRSRRISNEKDITINIGTAAMIFISLILAFSIIFLLFTCGCCKKSDEKKKDKQKKSKTESKKSRSKSDKPKKSIKEENANGEEVVQDEEKEEEEEMDENERPKSVRVKVVVKKKAGAKLGAKRKKKAALLIKKKLEISVSPEGSAINESAVKANSELGTTVVPTMLASTTGLSPKSLVSMTKRACAKGADPDRTILKADSAVFDGKFSDKPSATTEAYILLCRTKTTGPQPTWLKRGDTMTTTTFDESDMKAEKTAAPSGTFFRTRTEFGNKTTTVQKSQTSMR